MSRRGGYGLMAEFGSAQTLVEAAHAVRCRGYTRFECYAPFSVPGLPEAVGVSARRIPLATLIGGVLGGGAIYLLQWYSAVVDYPMNSGGRPLNSWQVFIPPTFEMTILAAALAAFCCFLLASGLPRLHHPIFDAPDFDLAMRNRFFLCVRGDDALFDAAATEALLRGLRPQRIVAVDDE